MKEKNQKKMSKKAAIPAVLALSVTFWGLLLNAPAFAESASAQNVLFKAMG